LADGQVLLQTLVLSPDPYMRGRMTGLSNFYIPQLPLGEVITGFGVARVIESKNPGYKSARSSTARCNGRRQASGAVKEYMVGGGGLQILDPAPNPLRRALDVLGITGITAYFSIMRWPSLAKAKPW